MDNFLPTLTGAGIHRSRAYIAKHEWRCRSGASALSHSQAHSSSARIATDLAAPFKSRDLMTASVEQTIYFVKTFVGLS
jgi:hypothetical protein